MTKEYQQLYKEHGELMLESFKELNIYLNGYRSLKDSANPAENKLNLFRLTYCAGDQGTLCDPFLIKGLKYPVRNKSH